MSKEYPLEIVTPAGKIFDDNVQSLSAPGEEGSFGILTGHAPFLSLLKKGVVKLVTTTEISFFAINNGTLEVNSGNQVTILADKVVKCQSEQEANEQLLANLK